MLIESRVSDTMNQENLNIAWILIAAALVLSMQVGFCFLESGLVRAKNSINVAIKNMADLCVSAAVFWAIGFGIMFGASAFGVWGTEFFFIDSEDNWWLTAFFIFQLVFCGTATTIISGAVAERMRFGAYIIIALFTSAMVYPVFGHWAWAGTVPGTEPGWLANLGFLDFAGSTVVHSVGGWVAFAAILVIGPRIGQFDDGKPKINGHNLTLASAGVIILWFGWIGFNGGSTLAVTGDVPRIIANTIIAGAFGGVAAIFSAYAYYGMARAWAVMNGIIGGLVSITACCNVVSTPSSAIIGACAGVICFFGIRLLERLRIDDAVGAVPAHAFCGVWGTLAVALFGQPEQWGNGFSRTEQLSIQLIGILTCFLWTFFLSLCFFKLLNRFHALRVTPEEEIAGLNVSEHGATTDLIDLISEMNAQERSGSFSQRVYVEPHTEVGQIAAEYNRVLNRVEEAFLRKEEATRQARQSQSEAVRANEVKSNFLANMSHELRTPLGIIIGYVELVQEDLSDSESLIDPDDLNTIAQASHYLLHLINGILDISKIESGQMEVCAVPLEIRPLIRELTQTVAPLIRENRNTLKVEMKADIGTFVADEVKLQQCLLNLISNAAKFTKDGQITLRVFRGTSFRGIESVYFEVEDTGIGIRDDQKEAIFKAFTQADTSTTRKYGGTGLGLAITKSFCRIMNGDVTVRSVYGEGSCFTIEIPADQEPLDAPILVKVDSTMTNE